MGIDIKTLAAAQQYVKKSFQGAGALKGENGVGISKIEKIGTEGLSDIYRISYTNGKTQDYTVTNGAQGEQGIQGIQGLRGEKGDIGADGQQGIQGIQGEKGNDGYPLSNL